MSALNGLIEGGIVSAIDVTVPDFVAYTDHETQGRGSSPCAESRISPSVLRRVCMCDLWTRLPVMPDVWRPET